MSEKYPAINTGIGTGKADKSIQNMSEPQTDDRRSWNETQNELDEYDSREKVERTENGFRLTIESTRGTGTRDQDTVKVEGKAEEWETLNEKRTAMRTALECEMNQRRIHQPDTEESGE